MKKVFAYLRTSSETNKDSNTWQRQQDTINSWAKASKASVVETFNEIITGTTAERPIFASMISSMNESGIKTFVVENQSRLGRDLLVNLHLIASCRKMGIQIIDASTGDDLCANSDPMVVAMTQISGVFAQLEKSQLVSKLKKARDAKSSEVGHRVEGRKRRPYAQALVERVKKLRRKPVGSKRKTLDEIASILNKDGIRTASGKLFHPFTISNILKQKEYVR